MRSALGLRSCIKRLRSKREAGPDVLLGAVCREPHGPRTATDIEVTVRARLRPLPLEKHRLRAALAAHEANRLALNDLGLRVDAGARPVAEAVADHLCEVAHEIVIGLEAIRLDADDRTIVRDSDQEVP